MLGEDSKYVVDEQYFIEESDEEQDQTEQEEGGGHKIEGKTLVYEEPNHAQSLLHYLNTLRKTGTFCDLVLQVGSRTISAHRAVLGCASVHIFELLAAQEGGGPQSYCELDMLDFDSLQTLVNYAYSARLEVSADQVKSVYKTATMLKMQSAADACAEYLADKLTVSNCLGIRSFANSYSDEQLTSKTDTFIQANMAKIVKCKEVRQLPCVLVDIVGMEDETIEESSKWQLSKLAVNWVQQQLASQALTALAEDPHVLCLTSDNTLQDCLDLADDRNSNNIITDYKKLSKRKQIGASRGKEPPSPGSRSPTDKHDAVTSPRVQLEPQLSVEREWKLLASLMLADHCCTCIAILDNTLVRVSITFHSQPSSANGYNTDGSVSPTGSCSPRGSITSANGSSSKHCSLLPLAPMNSARCGVGTAALDGKLIVLGGYDRGECLKTVEAYDPATNTWSPMQSMLSPRGRFDVSQLQSKLFACGGSNGSQELKSVECYDPESGKWSPLPDLESQKSGIGVAVLDGSLYVVGGWTGFSGVARVEMFNPQTEVWKKVASLNEGRYQAGACVLDGQLIIVGGCNSWHCLHTVEAYDPTLNQWISLPQMAVARRGAGVTVFKEKLFVVGGTDGQSSLSTVEIYDPKTQTWSFGPTLSAARANVGVCVVDNRLYAVGGFCGKAFLDTIEYLQEDGQEWCSFAPVPRSPSLTDASDL